MFSVTVKDFLWSLAMELENEKTETLNDENENKENKSVDEFREFILQQNPANTVSLSLNKNTK